MTLKKEIFRIADANFNRSREGLRVCEDIARFMMNSKALAKELKTVRHGITGIMKSLRGNAKTLVESRNVRGDVGKMPALEIEILRRDPSDIFTANIERVKESIRVLEEFFKLIDIKLSVKLLSLRFKTYDIEKKAAKKLASLRNSR